jgi:malate dehydrogenase (oxaloacetate-decarboxylating)
VGPVHQPTVQKEPSALSVDLTGYDLLNNPRLNKGTAFTEEERTDFELHGLLPPHVGTLEKQMQRRREALSHLPDGFAKYSFMRDLQDTNETLFYAMLTRHTAELMPIVYTPTVGEGCRRFSEIWRKPRGLFLSYPNRDRIEQILSHPHHDQVKCIVVSDGERILGLGDQGAGGMGIPIGKLALYTALGGIAPESCLPILLDVGTDNEERLEDPIYIGWRHRRVRGQEYDDFIESFVSAVKRRWPHVLLQWEDFAGANACRLLQRYRDRLCTFNDDIQGTAAVATAMLLSAVNATGVPLEQQRIAIVGFGAAGTGIANLLHTAMTNDGLTAEEACQRIYAVDRYGLVVEGGKDLRPDQMRYVRPRAEVQSWQLANPGGEISLLDVVRNVKPTALIGVSAQPGAFTEEAVREMARHVSRPVILPLSNPTSRCEATPEQILSWTEGRAIVGTGSPFPPVQIGGRSVHIDQTNNAYIFPGLALGIVASMARRVSDTMIMAAAKELAALSPARGHKEASLLPPLADSRRVSRNVAEAVARQAISDGLAGISEDELDAALEESIWEPQYVPYQRANSSCPGT